MPEDVKIWEIVQEDTLKEIPKAKLDTEGRIEKWVEQDISILSDNLLVIGRQVGTDFGGIIDILCIDQNGDLVIVELKRDKTPREVAAQTLDYASWVQGLLPDRLTEIANSYLNDKGTLEEVFKKKFNVDFPEILNESHGMLIVASEIDASTERIIKYLNQSYGVRINVATFKFFRNEEDKEFLARLFLVEPNEMRQKGGQGLGTKRRSTLSLDELQQIAEEKGIGELHSKLIKGLEDCFDYRGTTRSTVAFIGAKGDSHITILSLVPGQSNSDKGARFQVYIDKFAEYLGVLRDEALAILPSGYERTVPWKGGAEWAVGFFKDEGEADTFIAKLKELRTR